ncbi:MAG TPA: D-ribose pyranase [Bacillota bacterium]|nr:D-ribose pyranase [Bacillota bacterium]
MKKSALLNSELSYVVANMRHKDMLVIGDAGLPIPEQTDQIDLAVTKGVPDFLTVLKTVLTELRVEKIILAGEIREMSGNLHGDILGLIERYQNEEKVEVAIDYISHEDFKAKTACSKAVVRTGEFTPYANIILVSGVVF